VTSPAVLPAVSYRDMRQGQLWGVKLPGQRSLLLMEGGPGREANTATPSIQGVGTQDRVVRSTQVKRC